jgi:hypothetical protein
VNRRSTHHPTPLVILLCELCVCVCVDAVFASPIIGGSTGAAHLADAVGEQREWLRALLETAE